MRDPARGIAEWTGAPRTTAQADACARCHARRRPIRPILRLRPAAARHARSGTARGRALSRRRPDPGRGLRVRVVRAEPHVQGRRDVLGLSRAHALALRAEGNAVCAQCHAPREVRQPGAPPSHGGLGAAALRLVSHAVATYMVVDPRRDHSFRIPRPDLATALQDARYVHAVPPRPAARVGGRADRAVVWGR